MAALVQPIRRRIVPRRGTRTSPMRMAQRSAHETGNADDDQVDGHDVVEQARHQQDENSGNECDDRLKVYQTDGHQIPPSLQSTHRNSGRPGRFRTEYKSARMMPKKPGPVAPRAGYRLKGS